MKPLVITCGDPAGVGPEIIARWLRDTAQDIPPCVVVGPASWLETLPPTVQKFPVGSPHFVLTPGLPTEEGAAIAFAALEEAAHGTQQGAYRAVVTAPVSKECMNEAGYVFVGHTEYFADIWGGSPSMAFVGQKMRMILATWHSPLMQIGPLLRSHPELLHRAVERAVTLAQKLGVDRPRVGVCGLNPHAGEGGLIGSEEKDFIDPMLETLQDYYPGLSRCLPGDTVFYRHLQGEFDVVVALYHDQGLAPLKALEFDTAVNITLGLPHLRVSPDHGTAYGIAGQGIASIRSFAHAVSLAQQLTSA